MSTVIMSLCWPLQMPPTAKAVLISLADNANDHGACWPSLSTISDRTCFSERAVQGAIKWLEAACVLVADRSNGRHTRYQINPNAYQPPQELHPRSKCAPAVAAPTPAAGAPVPPQEMRQPPQEVPTNHQEPSLEPSRNRKEAAPKYSALSELLARGVDEQTAGDWVQHRKKKRASDAITVIEDRQAEAQLAGYSLAKALRTEISRGWQGFEASWVKAKEARQPYQTANDKAKSLADRLTGKTRNDNASPAIIDLN